MASLPDNPPATPVPLPDNLPPEVMEFLREVDYLSPDRLKAGDLIPAFALSDLKSGETVWLGGVSSERPTALIFGSYT